MASISSLMGSTSSSSSIYGSRNANIISGLASGLDTESMIEGLVESYKQKITGLQQDRTKVQWQQEAYQSVSDKLVEFYRTYMSFAYNSSTNLFSSSFFNNASNVVASGEFAKLVSATGRSNSEIVLKSVAQLAQAARYTTSGGTLNTGFEIKDNKITTTGEAIKENTYTSKLEGTIDLQYGGDKKLSIDLGALDLVGTNNDGTGALDPKKLEDAINKQLEKQSITIGDTTYTGKDVVEVQVTEEGNISFKNALENGNDVKVTGVSGKLSEALQAKPDENSDSIQLKSDVVSDTTNKLITAEALTGKKVTVTLDGKTKTFVLGENLDEGEKFNTLEEVYNDLEKQVKDAFGDKIGINFSDDNKLSFTVANGSTLSVTSEVGETLGLGTSGLSSYLNTGKTLEDLLGKNMGGLEGHTMKTTQTIKEVKADDGTISYQDADGNTVDREGFFLDEDGKRKMFYDLTINGKKVGSFDKDASMDKVINTINSSDAGVKVQYSKITNQFVFTAKDTGEAGRIEITDGLGAALFGAVDPDNGGDNYVKGQDAIFQVEVNGQTMNLARSSNSVEIDGMTLEFKGTFNEGTGDEGGVISSDDLNNSETVKDIFGSGEAVTFKAETDADKIVDAVKKMVEDYNEIMNSVKDLYTTRPAQTNTGKSYEPLTDEEADGMTETEIENYEEKAKQGILYMDSDLSSLYSSLRGVLTGNSGLLKSIGLSTEYSDGKTTLKLDETALRQAIAEDPEAVKDAFVSSKENGAATDGLMAQMYKVVNNYAGTSGATKGILIEKAGSKYAPTAALDNTMLDKMNDIDDEIEKWQGKLSDKVDYYTNKFTQLEMLINQMNSQSSALSGLMGG